MPLNSWRRPSERWSTLLIDRSSSLRSWETTRMAPGNRSSSSISQRLAGRSRWLVGSSRIMVSGPWKSILIRSTRRRWPPDRLSMSSKQELLAQPEPVGQTGHGGLGLVAAVLPELLLEIGEELDVLGARVLGHLGPGLVEGVVEDVESPSGQDVGEADGLETEAVGHRYLGQVAVGATDGRVAGGAHVAAGLVDDHRDEGGLARAVPADQPDLLAGADHERGVAQQRPVADFDGEGGTDDHQGSGLTWSRPEATSVSTAGCSRRDQPHPVSHSRSTGAAHPTRLSGVDPAVGDAPSRRRSGRSDRPPSAGPAPPGGGPWPGRRSGGREQQPPVGHADQALGAEGADLLDPDGLGRRDPEAQPRLAAEPAPGAEHQGSGARGASTVHQSTVAPARRAAAAPGGGPRRSRWPRAMRSCQA